MGLNPTRGSSFFLEKATALGVLCYSCLVVCLFDLACFFLPSFSSLIKTCIHECMYTCTYACTCTRNNYCDIQPGYIQDFLLGGGGKVFSHASTKHLHVSVEGSGGIPPRKYFII